MPQDTRNEKYGGKLPQFRSVALVAVGSNSPSGVGDARETIQKGIEAVHASFGVIRKASRYYSTPAFPAGAGPDFVNAAFTFSTNACAEDVLELLHRVEAAFGRTREKRWAARTLDLDMIAFDEQILPDRKTFLSWKNLPFEQQLKEAPDQLILPHPRMHERAFVLVPLADVAPEWRHPVFGSSVREMLSALPKEQISEVVALQ